VHGSRHRLVPVALLLATTLALAACGSDGETPAAGGTIGDNTETVTLRRGYFPNVTHAPAIIGVQDGAFADALGDNVDLKLSTYNSGTEVTTAILAGALDASFVGPNPAINAFQKSDGKDIRVVAGTASGGAFLIVKPDITSVADLEGKKLATPSLGNTQDVALRAFLKTKGLETDTEGGGDVSIIPQDNSTTVTAFESDAIDGAWVPEPYATLLQNAGGKILVDEATLWPEGKFVTTHLLVTTKFLTDHPEQVSALIEGLAASIDLISSKPAEAKQLVSDGIDEITGKPLPIPILTSAFKSIRFTLDPISSSLKKDAVDAKDVGLIDSSDLEGIYDLTLLNEYLKGQGDPEITP
jgi:NitT/TauT family transport system substrate-binding protein